MFTNNIQCYKLTTRFRKTWYYSKSFNEFINLREWLENIKNHNRDLYGFYKANYYNNDYNLTCYYFIFYQDKKNIVIETFLDNVIRYNPFVKEWINNDRL